MQRLVNTTYFFIIKIIFIFYLLSCSSDTEKKLSSSFSSKNKKVDWIFRKHHEYIFKPRLPTYRSPPPTSWQQENLSVYPIRMQSFACRGHYSHPSIETQGKNAIPLSDCLGHRRHSLPLVDQKEHIYPILIDLLNYIQNKTHKNVIITCGHRCPVHNQYADPSQENLSSKHQIGAEVDFYVEGLESDPQKIIDLLLAYYSSNPQYQNRPEYTDFKRYDKKTNTTTLPWFNREIFIKLFLPHEGRDWDNQHPFPYINLQVRYDSLRHQSISYTWERAQSYKRW